MSAEDNGSSAKPPLAMTSAGPEGVARQQSHKSSSTIPSKKRAVADVKDEDSSSKKRKFALLPPEFWTLPRELRDIIYDYALSATWYQVAQPEGLFTASYPSSTIHDAQTRGLPTWLRTSKAFWAEGIEQFHRLATCHDFKPSGCTGHRRSSAVNFAWFERVRFVGDIVFVTTFPDRRGWDRRTTVTLGPLIYQVKVLVNLVKAAKQSGNMRLREMAFHFDLDRPDLHGSYTFDFLPFELLEGITSLRTIRFSLEQQFLRWPGRIQARYNLHGSIKTYPLLQHQFLAAGKAILGGCDEDHKSARDDHGWQLSDRTKTLEPWGSEWSMELSVVPGKQPECKLTHEGFTRFVKDSFTYMRIEDVASNGEILFRCEELDDTITASAPFAKENPGIPVGPPARTMTWSEYKMNWY